jgi:thioester reductase-like protein
VAQARSRIYANLERYRLGRPDVAARVIGVPGDLSLPLLGLGPSRFRSLAESVDAVYHCGARVNWTYPYSALKGPNVVGTREVVRLATCAELIPIHFISTVGVFSSADCTGKVVREDAELDESGPLTVGYAQSKWVAEKLVTMARDRGLAISIYRPATAGDSRTGVFNPRDHVGLILKGCVELGLAPDYDAPIQLAPIDYVACAIVYLSLQDDQVGKTFHLVNPQTSTWSELFDWARMLGHRLDLCRYSDWLDELLRRSKTRHDNALFGLIPLFSEAMLEPATLPVFDCANTLAGLAGSGIDCPPMDQSLVATLFAGSVESGFLDRSPGAVAEQRNDEVAAVHK